MATIERDPLICEQRIQKRREFLIEQYEENKLILANPALVSDDSMKESICSNEQCLLNNKVIDIDTYKKLKWAKILSIVASIALIILCLAIAILIGNGGQ
ncbi:hypothetical protein KQ872_00015 [Mycoplasma sp. ES3225-GEN-MYC]|uniref:Uncharacterized protein n=1 Tax=Mycoplasma miroungigenitalium TaxID=754515 RepID=A0A6M4J8D9_9MOLU|nr:hypothetical protein [Mycoplasma miroungigenitalium]MBU4691364.1 hypothetical protein [Mycoplasma miroungigenitalium]QJR43200.1 hypothetical protein HLA87_00015 [Mycoplasma miroungigenitalium]